MDAPSPHIGPGASRPVGAGTIREPDRLALSRVAVDTAPVTRATATLGGLAALVLSLTALGFAMFATADGSTLGGLAKAVVLALSGGAIASACGGLAVATEGIPSRAWLLHGLAVLLAGMSYVVALAIAETA